ncbi:MAG: class III poly(R)-hydroxyalkanoic acid synthase subunit PhaC [Steroidobacteraceae bacterium]
MSDKNQTFDPQVAMRELVDFSSKFAAGIPALQAASGVEIGCSDKEAVFRDDKITLYRYKPIAKPAGVTPLLISYALVNRPYMMDLQSDRSLIRRLLEQGLDIYLIDWGYPNGADRFLDLDDYINGFLHNCVQHVLDEHRIESTNVLGVCQGGTFSLCYTALHPERVKNLVTMVTPVDFRTPENLLSKWAQDMDVDAVVDSGGNVSGEMLNVAYVSLMPFRLMQQKYVGLVDILKDPRQVENFMRMEKWIFDSPDQSGDAFRQFTKWFFQENRLVKGTVELGGRKVDLKKITQPVLNVYGRQDHLVPPSASIPMERYIGSKDYTAFEMDVGHIGMYVSGKSQKQLPETVAQWLKARE